MRHYTILTIKLFIILICGYSCSINNSKQENDLINEFNDNKLAVVYDTSYIRYLHKDAHFWTPANEDLIQLDSILLLAIKDGKFDFYKELQMEKIKKNYRQLLCYYNEHNERIIFMNSFCGIPSGQIKELNDSIVIVEKFDWQHHIIEVDDGGACFWQIKINLTKKLYYDFSVNGNASNLNTPPPPNHC